MVKKHFTNDLAFFIGAVVVFLIGWVLLPNLIRAQGSVPVIETGTSALAQIEHNLKVIEIAKEQWAFENKKGANDFVAVSDLTRFYPNHRGPYVAGYRVEFHLTTIENFAEAHLPAGVTLNGKAGPFTVTSF